MNADIDKIEKFILTRGLQTERIIPIREYLIVASVGFGVLAIFFFIMAHNRVSQMESIYFVLILVVLVSLVSILTIKVIAKNRICKAGDYKESSHRFIRDMIIVVAIIQAERFAERNFPIGTASIVLFAMSAAMGLVAVYFVVIRLYKVYLMRKYAPYFKDTRLLRD